MRHHIPFHEWLQSRSEQARSEAFGELTEDEFNEGCETSYRVEEARVMIGGVQ